MDPFIAHATEPGADGPLISVAEAAARLGVRGPAIRARLRRGTLKGEYRGGQWFVAEASLPTASTSTLEADMIAAEVSELELALMRSERDAARARADALAAENSRLLGQLRRLERAISALVAETAGAED